MAIAIALVGQLDWRTVGLANWQCQSFIWPRAVVGKGGLLEGGQLELLLLPFERIVVGRI